MSELISSKDNKKVKAAYAAKNADGDLFLAEGFHNVEMALDNELVISIFALKEMEKTPGVPFYLVTPEIIAKLSFTRSPEGIVALCQKKKEAPLASDRLLYLEGIQDPANVGALLRSALAFGFLDVVLAPQCADPYNPKALLAGQGAIFSLNAIVSKEPSMVYLPALKSKGYFLIGTALQEAEPFEGFKAPSGKIALLLGNEGQGLSKDALGVCSAKLRISMGGIDSLNVGVAGGIIMHDLRL